MSLQVLIIGLRDFALVLGKHGVRYASSGPIDAMDTMVRFKGAKWSNSYMGKDEGKQREGYFWLGIKRRETRSVMEVISGGQRNRAEVE